jgi:putative membrane protein
MEATAKVERTLVLCVDRDDDLGVKAEIDTPVLGREKNLNAAVSLALRDPEEPDANAIFEAVRIFDRLKEAVEREGGECQIATIAGSELGGVGADRKLVSEFNEVLKTFPATDIVLVVDGFTDEAILPLIQSRVPVTSVRRITVRHSQSIEETAWLFSRYLKMLIENPRYARIALGLPGILLIVIGILTVFNMLVYTWIAFLLVLGFFLAIKGFGLDRAARNFYIWVREYTPPPFPVQIAGFSAVAGFLLVGIGFYQGLSQTSTEISRLPNPPVILSQWVGLLPKIVGWFLANSITLIVIGICILLSGRAIRWFFERDNRLWRTLVIVVVVAWSSQVFYEASRILVDPMLGYGRLVFTIVVSIIWTVLAVLVTSLLHKKYADLFMEEEEIGEKEEKVEEG